MAIQQWTIFKLVGPAAVDAAGRFDRWWNARRSDDLSCFTPNDWDSSVRRSAATYVSRLLEHRWEMPVAYFNQPIDHWLAGGQIQQHLVGATAHILHDAGELWCYRLPDRGTLVSHNRTSAQSSQFPESGWLAGRLVEAAEAYAELWPEAVLLINRQAINPSPTDDELRSRGSMKPKWIR